MAKAGCPPTHSDHAAGRLNRADVVAAEVLRQSGRARNDLIEHSAQGRTTDRAWLHGEADDSPAAEARVPPFHFNDRRDQSGPALSGPAFAASARRATDTYDSPRLGETP
jgi:hypothetical protein